MTQEVRVMLQLTLDVDATLSKNEIERRLDIVFAKDEFKWLFNYLDMDVQMVDIIEIREEAEIYGNE